MVAHPEPLNMLMNNVGEGFDLQNLSVAFLSKGTQGKIGGESDTKQRRHLQYEDNKQGN